MQKSRANSSLIGSVDSQNQTGRKAIISTKLLSTKTLKRSIHSRSTSLKSGMKKVESKKTISKLKKRVSHKSPPCIVGSLSPEIDRTSKVKKNRRVKKLKQSQGVFMKKFELQQRKINAMASKIQEMLKENKQIDRQFKSFHKKKKKKSSLLRTMDNRKVLEGNELKKRLASLHYDLQCTKELVKCKSPSIEDSIEINGDEEALLESSDLVSHFRLILLQKHHELDQKFLQNRETMNEFLKQIPEYTSSAAESLTCTVFSDKEQSEESFRSDMEPIFEKPIALELSDHETEEPEKPQFPHFDFEIEVLLKGEIFGYLNLVQFKKKPPEVDSSFEFFREVIEHIFLELIDYEEQYLLMINTPIYNDPLKKLHRIQHKQPKTRNKIHLLLSNLSSVHKKFNENNSYNRSCYIKMMLDCINEALNYIRPYGLQGLPQPWSRKSIEIVGESTLVKLFDKVDTLIMNWWRTKNSITRESYAIKQMIKDDLVLPSSDWMSYEDDETKIICELERRLLDLLVVETLDIS